MAQTYTGQGFKGGEKLPDYLCAAIVQHYAIKGKPEANQSLCLYKSQIKQNLAENPLGFLSVVL